MSLPRSIHVTSIDSLNRVDAIAIAVHSKGGHLGILNREQVGRPLMYAHLCGYNNLQNVLAWPNCCALWIQPELDPDEAEQVTANLRLVATLLGQNEFPYAFSSPQGFFDQQMKFEQGPGKLGLTCATFILAVFNATRIDLVNYKSWPIRPDDPAQREYLIGLAQIPADIATMVRNEKFIAPHYRPLEVAGAAAQSRYPVRFRTARKCARRLRALLAFQALPARFR